MNAPQPLPRKTYFNDADRAGIAAGYRHIADLIESGHAPIPMNLHVSFAINSGTDDQATAAAELRRALGGGQYEKRESARGSYLYLDGMCGGLPVQVWMDRDAVCERIVVGKEWVKVPALPAQPARVEVREVVEWRCHPILDTADDTAEVSA